MWATEGNLIAIWTENWGFRRVIICFWLVFVFHLLLTQIMFLLIHFWNKETLIWSIGQSSRWSLNKRAVLSATFCIVNFLTFTKNQIDALNDSVSINHFVMAATWKEIKYEVGLLRSWSDFLLNWFSIRFLILINTLGSNFYFFISI